MNFDTRKTLEELEGDSLISDSHVISDSDEPVDEVVMQAILDFMNLPPN